MDFVLSKSLLKNQLSKNEALFYQEKEAFSGVHKIAEKVMSDIEKVFGVLPKASANKHNLGNQVVLYGTVHHSPILDELYEKGLIDLSQIIGKREVFSVQVVQNPFDGIENALVIAGSDKRGTIYGLFHLSELLDVSPLVNWSNIFPEKKESFSIKSDYTFVSKEPSVRFRGFFINDEWPAFGNWTMKRFGGFNAKMYEHVFELLLRLKGNYLWPAMWSARFYDDGPGLANAELADELGVVMGASHHEPCLRYGEEYKYLRGKDSKYGDAWNFRTNREGITKFWEDGLKRGSEFESVITVGMRGEADTPIMGREATLRDNIELLQDVLKTQNQLIQENVNSNLSEVPRMFALYKEVEPFFYGDESTPGLINSEELEDVILMFCDDNHGNLRTLPTEDLKDHKGGFGMYYHFDYHGGPISYEWINSSYLPKIWEQMTMAYDFGIRDLWIVNVGDIATQEYPLSFFLDLAYDFERWGTESINKTDTYTKQWIETQFHHVFDEDERKKIFDLLIGYTKIAHNRRPEMMNVNVYHPVNYKETDHLLEKIDELLAMTEELYKAVDPEYFSPYFSLVHYPVVGNLNLQKMWLITGKNHYAAKLGKMETNKYADKIRTCMVEDRRIVEEYHTIDDGRWYGMGLSEHIGFTRWNEDECQNPIIMNVLPANKPRLVVTIDGTEQSSEGSLWHVHTLYLEDFLNPEIHKASFTISSLSDLKAEYKIKNETDWLTCSSTEGILDGNEKTSEVIYVEIDRSKINDRAEGKIIVEMSIGTCTIIVKANNNKYKEFPAMTFVDTQGYIAIEAEHFAKNVEVEKGSKFQIIEGYGKTLSAIKAFPTNKYFSIGKDAPYVEYLFAVKNEGTYELELCMNPSNPVTDDPKIECGLQVNDDDPIIVNTLPDGYRVDDKTWAKGVLDNIRKFNTTISCKEGVNRLRIYAVTPAFVLEKLVIYPGGKKPAESYLGPTETYYVKK